MTRALLLLALTVATPGQAKDESLHDRFQEVVARTATRHIPDNIKARTFCNPTELTRLSSTEWESSTRYGVIGQASVMNATARSRPVGPQIGNSEDLSAWAVTHREVKNLDLMLRPLAFVDLDVPPVIGPGQTLSDFGKESVSRYIADPLPILDDLYGPPDDAPQRIGYSVLLTLNCAQLPGEAVPRPDETGPWSHSATRLMR